jgi:hypothetical protein
VRAETIHANRFEFHQIQFHLGLAAIVFLAAPLLCSAASWTPLTNLAPSGAGVMLQLPDGTIMIQRSSNATWMRLTPDAQGSYIKGTWSTAIATAPTRRLYFASQVLPNGKVWILGGEYSGPAAISNWSNTGEIYDLATNTWTPIAPYPNQTGCPTLTQTTGNITTGTNIITNLYNSGYVVGGGISGTGIPAATTITSVDSVTQIHISNNATATTANLTLTLSPSFRAPACFGDVPTMLLPGLKIFAGNLLNNSTYIYDVTANTWTPAASKFYADRSDEEGWVKLPDGSVFQYDVFKSIAAGSGYAEKYNPTTNSWSSVSPGDGTANGVLPILSTAVVGDELGPTLRLQDGRILVLGGNQHSALYTPATNTWAAGPDMMGTISGVQFPFGADDAPGAVMPNGHVLFTADFGPGTNFTGNTTTGANIITGIANTTGYQVGWAVSGTGIAASSTIASINSLNQITLNNNATATGTGVTLKLGATFSKPTQVFDFNPSTSTFAPVSPPLPDSALSNQSAFVGRMLVLPTGQVLFSDSSAQLWVYTPDGAAPAALRPVINSVVYNGGGIFTLTGQQLNGQSAGSAYGDDVQTDENYPIVRFTSPAGSVFYAQTSNWSSTGVATGSTLLTTNFKLNPAMPAGTYALIVSGAGIASAPLIVNITQAAVNGQ